MVRHVGVYLEKQAYFVVEAVHRYWAMYGVVHRSRVLKIRAMGGITLDMRERRMKSTTYPIASHVVLDLRMSGVLVRQALLCELHNQIDRRYKRANGSTRYDDTELTENRRTS